MKKDNNVLKFQNKRREEVFQGVLQSYREQVATVNATESAVTLDLSAANIFRIKLHQNVVNISFDNLPDPELSYSCTLILLQDNNGNRRVNFPESVLWSFNEKAILSRKPGHADVITLMTYDGGETFYAAHAMANLGR